MPEYENFGNGAQAHLTLDPRLRPDVGTLTKSGASLLDRKTLYFANGNIQQVIDNLVAGRSQTFTYDNLNRVATAQSAAADPSPDAWQQTYLIDPWSNLYQTSHTKGSVPDLNASANAKNGDNLDRHALSPRSCHALRDRGGHHPRARVERALS